MARQVNIEQLQERIAILNNRLAEANREIAVLRDKFISLECLKNRYYNGHIQIIAESSVWIPSKAMRKISEETIYGEEKAI
jgi:predicted RNase H-like nuclease (RuvC/YqgF family)